MCIYLTKPIISEIHSKQCSITTIGRDITHSKFIIVIAMSKGEIGSCPPHLIKQWRDLVRLLALTDSLSEFQQIVSEKMRAVGFSNWSYTQLDVPNALATANCIGSLETDQIKDCIENNNGQYDLMIDAAKFSNASVYQSQIEQQVLAVPFVSDRIQNYLEMLKIDKSFGYSDIAGIPLSSSEPGKYLIRTASNQHPKSLRAKVSKNMSSLRLIGSATDRVGCKHYPNSFLSYKYKYERLSSSIEHRTFLVHMANDHTDKETAKNIGISVEVVNEHLAKVRAELDSDTNHGAYIKLIQTGYSSIYSVLH